MLSIKEYRELRDDMYELAELALDVYFYEKSNIKRNDKREKV